MTKDDGPHGRVMAGHACRCPGNLSFTTRRQSGFHALRMRRPLPEIDMNRLAVALSAALLGSTLGLSCTAEAASRRIVRPNAEGGVPATAAVARDGARGAAVLRGRALRTDGQGSATAVSGAAVRGPNGATAARAGKTTVDADGSAAHRSGYVAQGAKGSLQGSGSATRSADGSVTQSRTTTATSSATGNSATTTESYSTGSGRSRSTACFDASGAGIACPGKP
jgi:hypothetical protein